MTDMTLSGVRGIVGSGLTSDVVARFAAAFGSTVAGKTVVISRDGAGINESFTVRKISYGEGVERVFPLFSPFIADVEVLRRGRVRRAKLYYLRDRRGKSARISERAGGAREDDFVGEADRGADEAAK